MKYLSNEGLLYFWGLIKSHVANAVANKVDKDGSKVLSDNNYTTTEKNKLANIESGANKYVHPSNTARESGLYKIIVDALGHVTGATAVTKADITGLGIPSSDTTYTNATSSKSGLMASTDKAKLDGVETGAEVNIIETVKVNGTAQNVTSKAIDITVPTSNSQLTNGAGYQTASQVKSTVEDYGYQTASQVNTAITGKGYQTASQVKSTVEGYGYQTQSQVNTLITGKGYQTANQVQALINGAVGDIVGMKFEIVTSLPTTGAVGTIYLKSNGGSNQNAYDEYVWIASTSKYEKIGTTDIDLTPYMKSADAVAITNSEIDTIVAS